MSDLVTESSSDDEDDEGALDSTDEASGVWRNKRSTGEDGL